MSRLIFKKYLVGLIVITIVSSVFFIPAKRAEAVWGVVDIVIDPTNLVQNTITAATDIKSWLKDFVLDTLAWSIANMMIQQMTQQTVKWINSGFQGNPLFPSNPGSLLKDAADQATGLFFSEFGLTGICAPFKVRIELALKTGANMPFQRRMQCTLSRAIENIEAFENDFLSGGWKGWIAVTQEPQNNIYGAYLESADELARRQAEAQNHATIEASWGQGFLSIKECQGATNDSPEGTCLSYCEGYGGELDVEGLGACVEDCISNLGQMDKNLNCELSGGKMGTVTPGSAIQDRLGKALGADFGRLEVADEINEILGALINHFITSALSNLRGGGDTNPPAPTTPPVDTTPIDQSTKKGAMDMIDYAISIEKRYRDTKQESLNTLNQIIDKLESCSPADSRIGAYESKETGINNDIANSNGLITDAEAYKTQIDEATTYGEVAPILDDFNNVIQPRMHSVDETTNATTEYTTLQNELTQINAEFSGCEGGTGGGGAPGTITVVTPISVWTPSQTINGWFPVISPDGKYVSYGFGDAFITDLKTKEEKSFKDSTTLGCFVMGWIRPDTYTYVCELSDNGPMARYEVKVGEWISRKTADNPSLVQGTNTRAADGHWASSLKRIVVDNSIVVPTSANPPGGLWGISGNYIIYACDYNDHSVCLSTVNGSSKKIYNTVGTAMEADLKNNYILYAGSSKLNGITPAGVDSSKTIGTFSFEGKPAIFLVRGAVWIASSVEDNATNKSYVILRPWNSTSAIVLDTGNLDSGSAALDVMFDGTNFVVAQNTNKGILKVSVIPENAPRTQF